MPLGRLLRLLLIGIILFLCQASYAAPPDDARSPGRKTVAPASSTTRKQTLSGRNQPTGPKETTVVRKPSANKGRSGVYQCKTDTPAYNYWVYVPASYSEDKPAGLHIFFHGQNNSQGADNFWVSRAMLDSFNLIGINMEYTDGDYRKDTDGKLAAAEQAVQQTMADYKVIPGRGIMASFSGGGIVHSLYFSRNGKQSSADRNTKWTFNLNALYGSNFQASPAGVNGSSWLVSLHENERNMGLPTVGVSQTRVAREAILASRVDGGPAEVVFLYVKGAGHGITGTDTAWVAQLFQRTDLAFAPFVYTPDYPEQELRQAVAAINRLAYGRAESAISQVLALHNAPPGVKAKAESLSRQMSDRIEDIVAMGKSMSENDPILCDTYGKTLVSQFAGHSRLAEIKAAFGPGAIKYRKEGLQNVEATFLSNAPDMVDMTTGKVGPMHRNLLETTIKAAGKNSQCGMMAASLLQCIE
ncbi:MAG: hypothetical protein WCL44_04895 [bacterium]